MRPSYRHISPVYREHAHYRLRAIAAASNLLVSADVFNLFFLQVQEKLRQMPPVALPAQGSRKAVFKLGEFVIGDIECPSLYGNPAIRY